MKTKGKDVFVMTDGNVFIAPCKDMKVQLTDKKENAEVWDYNDTLSIMKLSFHRSVTGLNLSFVQL